MQKTLAYLFGQPEVTGNLRTKMEDFKVFEQLPFEPCGEGEHLFIHIRKTGANTVFVARELAKYFSVKENLVSYAGLKDRFAFTEQWFGVHLPGKQTFDLTDLQIEGVEVLASKRHNKKLRIGALTGNLFELTLREVSAPQELARRWQAVCEHGVPNYFGEQRFGINGGNLERALALFGGQKVKDKKKRGMYLSAARSHIFNAVVSARIENDTFDKGVAGDVMMLAGTQSIFLASEVDQTIIDRLHEKDIDITAPMWGAGELKTEGEARAIEQAICDQYPEFCLGLPKFGLKQERRKARLQISSTKIEIVDSTVTLQFSLTAGSYATTVLRELLSYQDLTQRVTGSQENESKRSQEKL